MVDCDWSFLREPRTFRIMEILVCFLIAVVVAISLEGLFKNGVKEVTNNGTFGLSGSFADKSGSSKALTEPGLGVGVKSCFSCMACPKPHTAEKCPNDGNPYACITYEVHKDSEDKVFISRGCVKINPEAKDQKGPLRGCFLEGHNIKACYCDQDNCNWTNYGDNDNENEVKDFTESEDPLKKKVEVGLAIWIGGVILLIILGCVHFFDNYQVNRIRV